MEECQLACILHEMSADDDLVSEIIKHERKSREPVDCAGLSRSFFSPLNYPTTSQIVLPLLADITAARIKGQIAYRAWMEYMTGIIWKSENSLVSFLRTFRLIIVH